MRSVIMGALLVALTTTCHADFTGKVVKVHDGDTAHVERSDGTIAKVRFTLSDAPEIDQPHGVESRDFVRGLCLNKDVTVKTTGTDAFGRTLGEIVVDGVNVNKKTIEEGHAWWFYNFDNANDVEAELGKLMAQAMAGKKGLFAAEAPIYPRAWGRGARLGGGSAGGNGSSDGDGQSGDGGSPASGGGTTGPQSTIFIMALLPNPRGEDADNETVILANSSDVDASVDQWKLKDQAGGVFTISGTVPAGGTRTIRLNASLQLGNEGDSIELQRPDGDIEQTIAYESAPAGRFIIAE
jgi:micrococcal nuclease